MSLESHFRSPPAPKEADGGGSTASTVASLLPQREFGSADMVGVAVAGVAILGALLWVVTMRLQQPRRGRGPIEIDVPPVTRRPAAMAPAGAEDVAD